MTNGASRPAIFLTLLFASGFCGISYEILYARILSNLLGSQFVVNATILLTFMLGIGIGTRLAHRLWRQLWLIELGIGLYGALFALGYPLIDTFLYEAFPKLGSSLGSTLGAAAALLVVPSLLIGCSVPLLAGYLAETRRQHAFTVTYFLYNLGAATTALLIEFTIIRAIGLRDATLTVAGLNGLVALGLFVSCRDLRDARPAAPPRRPLARRPVVALVLASVASAVFQLLMIKLGEFLFGPFNETFALVLATVLAGIAVAAALVGRFAISFGAVLVCCLASLAAFLALHATIAGLYAGLTSLAAEQYWTSVLLKLAILVGLAGPAALSFGATVPALLARNEDLARESGVVLFWSSMGNAGGYLLMTLVLHRNLDYGMIAAVAAILVAAGLWIYARRSWSLRVVAVGGIALVFVAQQQLWDEELLDLGYRSYASRERLEAHRREHSYTERFKSAEDSVAIIWIGEVPYLSLNGYRSLRLPSYHEVLVGAYGALFAPRGDRALVLGVGTGATAGTVGLLFDESVAIEINEALIENMQRMKEYNFDLEAMSSVEIIHDDAIRFLKTAKDDYSLILNTVTTPRYFSASKLYTLDFLESVKRRLTPDGVYLTWLDTRTGDDGVEIILTALAAAFESCWMIALMPEYFLLVCSSQEIALPARNVVAEHERLRSYLLDTAGVYAELLPYGIVSTRALSLAGGGGAPLNTLDHPSLEFSISRKLGAGRLARLKRRLVAGLDLEGLKRQISVLTTWRPELLLLHYHLLLAPHPFADIWEPLVRRSLGGELDTRYSEVSRRHPRPVFSAARHYQLGRGYVKRGRQPEALVEFRAALEANPALEHVHLQLARTLRALGRPREAIGHFRAEWERAGDRHLLPELGEAYLQAGRPRDAQRWLDEVLKYDPQMPEAHFFLGLAYDALGNREEARRLLEQELELWPDHAGAREVLARWE